MDTEKMCCKMNQNIEKMWWKMSQNSCPIFTTIPNWDSGRVVMSKTKSTGFVG